MSMSIVFKCQSPKGTAFKLVRENLATNDASAEQQSGAPWRHGCTAESWLLMHVLRISGRLEYLSHCGEGALPRYAGTCGVLCASQSLRPSGTLQ